MIYSNIHNLEIARISTHNILEQQHNELGRYCEDWDRVDLWVSLMIYPMTKSKLHDHNIQEKEIYKISKELHYFFCELTGYDFETCTTDPLLFQPDWIYQINNFIKKYFHDDNYFFIRNRDHKTRMSMVFPCKEGDVAGYNDPYELIQAAIKNNNICSSNRNSPVVFEKVSQLYDFLLVQHVEF